MNNRRMHWPVSWKKSWGCSSIRRTPLSLGQFSAPAANEPGFVVQAEIFLLTIDADVTPAAEIEEVLWIDPATDGDVALAPLTRDLILPFYRASLTATA